MFHTGFVVEELAQNEGPSSSGNCDNTQAVAVTMVDEDGSAIKKRKAVVPLAHPGKLSIGEVVLQFN